MRPILYKQNASPPARAVLMVIDILGIDVDLQDLNPVFREQDAPEFKKVTWDLYLLLYILWGNHNRYSITQ